MKIQVANYSSILSSIFLDEFVYLENNINIFKEHFVTCDSDIIANLKSIDNIYYSYNDDVSKFIIEPKIFKLSFNDFIKYIDKFDMMKLERKIFKSIRYEVNNTTVYAHEYIKQLIHVRNKLAHANRSYKDDRLLVSDTLLNDIKMSNTTNINISSENDFSEEDKELHRYLESYVFHIKKINDLILTFIDCLLIIQNNYEWYENTKEQIIESDSSNKKKEIARISLDEDRSQEFSTCLTNMNIDTVEVNKIVKAFKQTSKYEFNIRNLNKNS